MSYKRDIHIQDSHDLCVNYDSMYHPYITYYLFE